MCTVYVLSFLFIYFIHSCFLFCFLSFSSPSLAFFCFDFFLFERERFFTVVHCHIIIINMNASISYDILLVALHKHILFLCLTPTSFLATSHFQFALPIFYFYKYRFFLFPFFHSCSTWPLAAPARALILLPKNSKSEEKNNSEIEFFSFWKYKNWNKKKLYRIFFDWIWCGVCEWVFVFLVCWVELHYSFSRPLKDWFFPIYIISCVPIHAIVVRCVMPLHFSFFPLCAAMVSLRRWKCNSPRQSSTHKCDLRLFTMNENTMSRPPFSHTHTLWSSTKKGMKKGQRTWKKNWAKKNESKFFRNVSERPSGAFDSLIVPFSHSHQAKKKHN